MRIWDQTVVNSVFVLGRWEQFGVTSYVARGCKSTAPAVYVSLMPYVEWIESTTGMKIDKQPIIHTIFFV